MKMKLRQLSLLLALLGLPFLLAAQDDDEFDMSAFEDSGPIKTYCNNKVLNLSPTKLISLSYDFAASNTWTTTAGDAYTNGTYPSTDTEFKQNHGLRIETNYPIVSTTKLIVNAYLNYWESRYNADASESAIGALFDDAPLRTTALGALAFKPLDDRHFLIFQVEGSLNGNYNFGSISPDLGKMKVGGAALFGWKTNDRTNVAVGVTRTFRGGRPLHIPILMWNKTFNDNWGVEMLLPARAALRRNFSKRSIVMFGYELEGQSYHLQGRDGADISPLFGSAVGNNDWELRKSEIRARLSWDKSINGFIWFNAQVGAVVAYRMDIDREAGVSEPWLANEPQIPFYARFGLQFVSP